ncbi:hypothetical protein GGR58DRAFT_466932 [Xylaria digitata]|nr:hypothetical protein GGR58DRAFT_466932 [Xylaria digitata]
MNLANTSKRSAEELSRVDYPIKRSRTKGRSPGQINFMPPTSSLSSSTSRTASQRIRRR